MWARATGKAAWVGLVGPIPNPKPTISADDADESSAPRGAAAFLSVTLLSAVMAFMATFN